MLTLQHFNALNGECDGDVLNRDVINGHVLKGDVFKSFLFQHLKSM